MWLSIYGLFQKKKKSVFQFFFSQESIHSKNTDPLIEVAKYLTWKECILDTFLQHDIHGHLKNVKDVL